VFAVLCPLPLSTIAQLGDELQNKHHLLVLSLPGGDITRKLDLAMTAGLIWNVQVCRNTTHQIAEIDGLRVTWLLETNNENWMRYTENSKKML